MEEYLRTRSKLMSEPPVAGTAYWKIWMLTHSRFFYAFYTIPKGKGERRPVEEPVKEIKAAQRQLLKQLQKDFKPHKTAYSTKGRGFVRNGVAHKDAVELLRIDIQHFYPNCTYTTLMENISDDKLKAVIEENSPLCFVTKNDEEEPHLPTGSPLSPFLASLTMKDVDEWISKQAEAFGGVYTRYLDDIAISFPKELDEKWKETFKHSILVYLSERGWPVHLSKSGWVNPHSQAVTVTGVDVRSIPKVTGKYIREKMRPALDAEAKRLINLPSIKPFYWNFASIETREDFLVNLSPKVKGEMAYIKSINENQYKQLADYFFKRFERYTQVYGNDVTEAKQRHLGAAIHVRTHLKSIERGLTHDELDVLETQYERLRSKNLPQWLSFLLAAQRMTKYLMNKQGIVIKGWDMRRNSRERPADNSTGS